METRLVRLKAVDRRRGHVLRRFTYKGITFQAGAGWYRVARDVSDHLADVHQVDGDEHSPLAFEVCTEAEARAIDEKEARDTSVARKAADDPPLVTARGVAPAPETAEAGGEERGRRGRKEKE